MDPGGPQACSGSTARIHWEPVVAFSAPVAKNGWPTWTALMAMASELEGAALRSKVKAGA